MTDNYNDDEVIDQEEKKQESSRRRRRKRTYRSYPTLNFGGNCRETIQIYGKVFEGELPV